MTSREGRARASKKAAFIQFSPASSIASMTADRHMPVWQCWGRPPAWRPAWQGISYALPLLSRCTGLPCVCWQNRMVVYSRTLLHVRCLWSLQLLLPGMDLVLHSVDMQGGQVIDLCGGCPPVQYQDPGLIETKSVATAWRPHRFCYFKDAHSQHCMASSRPTIS